MEKQTPSKNPKDARGDIEKAIDFLTKKLIGEGMTKRAKDSLSNRKKQLDQQLAEAEGGGNGGS